MIDYARDLNPAQYKAATTLEGPVLVIAGAGSGKTRTIVHRLAWLVERGWPAHSMLLLTFTRKAAHEMLQRASLLLGQHLTGVQGGTFHGFAFSVLRQTPPSWAPHGLCVMDAADSAAAIQQCREELGIGKGDRSFPKVQTVIGLLSKARNKELDIDAVLRREAQHLLPHAADLFRLGEAYVAYRRQHGLLDYDDLLFELERLFVERPDVLARQSGRFRQILVDEYQDTNKVQARLVRLLARGAPGGEGGGNVMAVGDDAQSIYAFRGATVQNILTFPDMFPGTRIVRLEENYRSVQPVLDVANALLANAPEGYRKSLFSHRMPDDNEPPVRLYRPLSDLTQAKIAAARVEELLHSRPADEIAVLFRAGYQSYHLEVELNKRGVAFRKYGGLRYTEAAHVKDVLAFARLVVNPLDLPSFERVAALTRGIGPKTARKLYDAAVRGDEAAFAKASAKYQDFAADMALIGKLRAGIGPAPGSAGPDGAPARVINAILENYRPRMDVLFPDDWPRRWQGLEELGAMAATYDDTALFIADLSLESPDADDDGERTVTLSTVHSAKGLEWSAVLLLDLVEDRFPSRHALARPDDFEEERRLMYVACTRAKDSLDLFVPAALFSRAGGGLEPATPSPFIRELPDFGEARLLELREMYGGVLARASGPPRFAPLRPDFGLGPGDEDDGDDADDDQRDEDERREASAGQGEAGIPRPAPAFPVPSRPAPAWPEPARPEPALAVRAPERAAELGFCRHKIFGRGKIVEALPPDKYRVNFPGMGLKVILAAYLTLE